MSEIEKKKGGVRRAHDRMTSSFMRPDMLYPFRNSASATDPAPLNLKHFFPTPSLAIHRFLVQFVSNSAKKPNSRVCALGMPVITGRHNCGFPGLPIPYHTLGAVELVFAMHRLISSRPPRIIVVVILRQYTDAVASSARGLFRATLERLWNVAHTQEKQARSRHLPCFAHLCDVVPLCGSYLNSHDHR